MFRFLPFHRGLGHQSLRQNEDFLLITWDSCRFDAFQRARLPNLEKFGPPRRGWAMGTYTLPAHVAMFQGFLPHAFCGEPFYNRFCQQLWRIGHRRIHIKPLVTFPMGTRNVVTGFRDRGYFTAGVAAMDWFRDAEVLREGFDKFQVTGRCARKQNDLLISWLDRASAGRDCFAFVNYGETHSPFEFEGQTTMPPCVTEQFDRTRLWNQAGILKEPWTFDDQAFCQQVLCAEYLDARTGELLDYFRRRGRPTTVVVCGDHGECFGENGLFGHAFYHEKVMEVPLLMFRLNAPPHSPPEPSEFCPDPEKQLA
jgi:membrane-anchored protein YejM (alkaline phosphatase superfamily)